VKTVKEQKIPKENHENDPNPSKDRTMLEGDNTSF
jgi:hypothetical protein